MKCQLSSEMELMLSECSSHRQFGICTAMDKNQNLSCPSATLYLLIGDPSDPLGNSKAFFRELYYRASKASFVSLEQAVHILFDRLLYFLAVLRLKGQHSIS